MATILLVEDDNNLREIYEARLQAEGYQIVSANDGEEALVVAKEKKPNLIIADVMMPKISGFEMLDILRNTDGLQNVKIIMLTALGQAEDQQKANSLGADRYLVKSQVTLEDIVNAAHELLADGGEKKEGEAAAAPQEPTTPTTDTAPAPTPATSTPDPIVAATPVAPTPADKPDEPATAISTTMPTPDSTPSPSPAPDPKAAATDDKILNDAVNNLTADSSPSSPSTDMPAPTSADPPVTPMTSDSTSAPMSTPASDAPAKEDTPADTPAPITPPSDMPSTTPQAGSPPSVDASPLEVNKDLQMQLKEDSEEVESADTTPSSEPEDVSSTTHIGIQPPPDKSSDYLSQTSAPEIESSPGSPMKVIKPIPAADKPNINTLIEQEQLNESVNTGVTDSTAGTTPTDPDQAQIIMPSQPEGTTTTTDGIAL